MRSPKAKSAPNQERILYDDLLGKRMDLLFLYQGMIRITILKNIALLTHALLTLFHGARGGNGWLSQAALARFPAKPGKLQRYPIHYQSQKKVPLDLIIFRGKGYQETGYLLVPRNLPLTAQEIVDLYAKRMSIEQGFRDWKTHLGVRGLIFRGVDPAPYLTRMLLAFSLCYLICSALGATEEAREVRAFVEIPRRKARHGTRRTLSVLTVGILRLSLPRFVNQAHTEILTLLQILSTGKGLIAYCASLPPP